MVETSNSNHNDTATDSVVPKSEPLPEGSTSSSVSTPEAEGEVPTQDVAQTQKRKGGRKPVRKSLHLTTFFLLPVFMVIYVFLFKGLALALDAWEILSTSFLR